MMDDAFYFSMNRVTVNEYFIYFSMIKIVVYGWQGGKTYFACASAFGNPPVTAFFDAKFSLPNCVKITNNLFPRTLSSTVN